MTGRTLAQHQADRPHVTVHGDGHDCGPYTPAQLVALHAVDLADAVHVEVHRGMFVGQGDRRRSCTPEFVAHRADGTRAWVVYPGGMRHSDAYRCDTHPSRPATRFAPAVGYRGHKGERAWCDDCAPVRPAAWLTLAHASESHQCEGCGAWLANYRGAREEHDCPAD